MTQSETLREAVDTIIQSLWTERNGVVVPSAEDLKLGNDAVKLEAAVLYADLAESTSLVDNHSAKFAAEVYKTYLHCAAKLIEFNGGVVTAYDRDRVMGIFIGNAKRSNAAKTALHINYAVTQIIQPSLNKQYPSYDYVVKQAVGVDVGDLLVARTGVRGANDLVWVGRSANYAAKLCGLRVGEHRSFITEQVYSQLNTASKIDKTSGKDMWEPWYWDEKGIDVYASSWRWQP